MISSIKKYPYALTLSLGLVLISSPFISFATQYDPGWPDIIYCHVNMGTFDSTSSWPQFPLTYKFNDINNSANGNGISSRFYNNSWLNDGLYFNSDTTPLLPLSSPSDCNNLSITELFAKNLAFNYGTNMSSSTDAIVGNVFNQIYLLGWFFFFFIVFWITFKITKR